MTEGWSSGAEIAREFMLKVEKSERRRKFAPWRYGSIGLAIGLVLGVVLGCLMNQVIK